MKRERERTFYKCLGDCGDSKGTDTTKTRKNYPTLEYTQPNVCIQTYTHDLHAGSGRDSFAGNCVGSSDVPIVTLTIICVTVTRL